MRSEAHKQAIRESVLADIREEVDGFAEEIGPYLSDAPGWAISAFDQGIAVLREHADIAGFEGWVLGYHDAIQSIRKMVVPEDDEEFQMLTQGIILTLSIFLNRVLAGGE